MPKRSAKIYIDDITLSIRHIQSYIKGMTYTQFVKDRKTIDAVVRNLEIIGEAAKMIPESIKEQYPGIPWNKMMSMRNHIAHEYFGVALDVVWSTAEDDLPELKKHVKKIRLS